MMKKLFIFSLVVGVFLNGIFGVGFGGSLVYADDDVGEVGDLNDSDALDDEAPWEPPEIYIKAVNPGYKIDGISNVGEMIELARRDGSDAPISLAGAAIGYTNSSGTDSILFEFPERSWMTGESILLRLASSPEHELAAVNYTKTLAMTAGLSLIVNGEVVDEVCWTGKNGCYKAFSSAKPTTLLRDVATGEFEHVLEYEPEYNPESYRVEVQEEEVPAQVVSQCKGVQFSEVLSYYETSKSEQFIEFYNPGVSAVNLDGCKVRYKNKKYVLSGAMGSEGYLAYYPSGFSLTKNPTSSNKIELIDTDDSVVDVLEYPNGQRKGTSYAFLGVDASGGEIWKTTYAPTPGAPNNYQEFRTCEAGKVINEVTGNCVKVTSVSEKICKEGYYLNILTGRCKKRVETTEKKCKDGYYLNPETNRCKKIVENKGADYGLEPENYEENSSFVALYAVLGVLGVGLVYLGWEFRSEIVRFWRKIFRRGS